MSAELQRLRALAIGHSLFAPTGLQAAVDRLGFVQADPIRAPARAQALILRHRVKGYRIGDLEKSFARLAVEEDYLYAYGFLARRVWQLLHPRVVPRLSALERRVLEAVRELGEVHPRALEARLGDRRVVNAWGGQSKATTRALDHLHHRGHLRVRGYYAMPMLWADRVVGWANASTADGGLRVELGYVARRPRERDFARELDAEIARLEEQLAG